MQDAVPLIDLIGLHLAATVLGLFFFGVVEADIGIAIGGIGGRNVETALDGFIGRRSTARIAIADRHCCLTEIGAIGIEIKATIAASIDKVNPSCSIDGLGLANGALVDQLTGNRQVIGAHV